MHFADGNDQRLTVVQERGIASQPAEPEMASLGGDLLAGSVAAASSVRSPPSGFSSDSEARPGVPQSEEMQLIDSVLGSDMGNTSQLLEESARVDRSGWTSSTSGLTSTSDALDASLLQLPRGSEAPYLVPPTAANHAAQATAAQQHGVLNSRASNKTLVVRHPPDTVLHFLLRSDSKLGRGGQGEVFLATNKDGGEAYAIKILQNLSAWSRAEKVAKTLHKHPHVNVICPIAAGKTEIGVVMLMELAVENLKQRADAECCGNYKITATYIKGVLGGLCHIHGLGLVHNDLKLQNVLVAANGAAKITDFDLSTAAGESVGSRTGTPQYIAPESLKVDASSRVVRHPSFDIWAVGVMVYEMLSGTQFLSVYTVGGMEALLCGLSSFDDLAKEFPNALLQNEFALDFMRQ